MAKKRYGRWRLDADEIVDTCLGRLEQALADREAWMEERLARYAKLRGWLAGKEDPAWEGASDAWLPMLAQNSIRLKAQLYNAVLANHPMIAAKARRGEDQGRERSIDAMLDWQFFHEIRGEQVVDDFISNFCDDGTAFAFVRWVREEQRLYDLRIFPPLPVPPLPPGVDRAAQATPDPLPYYLSLVEGLWPSRTQVVMEDAKGLRWTVTLTDPEGREREGTVDLAILPDDRIEALMSWPAVATDGPAVLVDDLEDVVVPPRVANLQPPSALNPKGAPWVYRVGTATLDAIRRRKQDGTYDLLDAAGLEAIEAGGSPPADKTSLDALKTEKDRQEGWEASWAEGDDESRETVECYERWDIDGDGFEEDVIFTIARQAKVLLRVRLLSVLYPGVPVRRPFAEARFISVPGRLYGIGLLELLESIYDLSKVMLDQTIDWGTIRNLPFFFYRAASGLKPEVMRVTPGEGIPLDNPTQDIYFPQLSGTGETFTLNMLQLLQTFSERLSMMGDLQLGRIPTGKASALRTTGTTMALLGQGDVRGEQILRRLFQGLSEIYTMMHRLNRRLLPAQKEIRLTGVRKAGESAYLEVRREDLDADIDFEFQATLLNTNRQVVSESLLQFLGVAMSPIALQLGLVGPEEMYRLYRDLAKARDLDPDRYLKPPAPGVSNEAISAEEALTMILQGEEPRGNPLEGPMLHLQKLLDGAERLQAVLATEPGLLMILQRYAKRLQVQQQQAQQQAQMAQMAQAMQTPSGQAPGPGGVLSTIAPPPPPEAQAGKVPEG